MTFERKKYRTTTPQQILACLEAGMSIRRAAEHLGVSQHGLRAACSLFGWHAHGWSGPKHNRVEMPVGRVIRFGAGLR